MLYKDISWNEFTVVEEKLISRNFCLKKTFENLESKRTYFSHCLVFSHQEIAKYKALAFKFWTQKTKK